MLIFGLNTNNLNIKQCLLKKDDLTLEKALKIASSMTLSQQRIKQLNVMDGSKEAVKEVLAVQSKAKFNSRGRHQGSYSYKNHQKRTIKFVSHRCQVNRQKSKKKVQRRQTVMVILIMIIHFLLAR